MQSPEAGLLLKDEHWNASSRAVLPWDARKAQKHCSCLHFEDERKPLLGGWGLRRIIIKTIIHFRSKPPTSLTPALTLRGAAALLIVRLCLLYGARQVCMSSWWALALPFALARRSRDICVPPMKRVSETSPSDAVSSEAALQILVHSC